MHSSLPGTSSALPALLYIVNPIRYSHLSAVLPFFLSSATTRIIDVSFCEFFCYFCFFFSTPVGYFSSNRTGAARGVSRPRVHSIGIQVEQAECGQTARPRVRYLPFSMATGLARQCRGYRKVDRMPERQSLNVTPLTRNNSGIVDELFVGLMYRAHDAAESRVGPGSGKSVESLQCQSRATTATALSEALH